jgi:hypothetical protein
MGGAGCGATRGVGDVDGVRDAVGLALIFKTPGEKGRQSCRRRMGTVTAALLTETAAETEPHPFHPSQQGKIGKQPVVAKLAQSGPETGAYSVSCECKTLKIPSSELSFCERSP